MNAIEIEEAISKLAEEDFDAAEFPFAFLEAFGNKATTIKRLRSGDNNKSDVEHGVLQKSNIHLATCAKGETKSKLDELRSSPQSASQKAKFILATDGEWIEAEDLVTGEPVACAYKDFPNHFGVFLPLAGISTVAQIKESTIDIRATGRLNKLYVELLKTNPEWAKADRRHDMNHFMARLIFCFFAEDTDIFNGAGLFTKTVEQFSTRDSSNTHDVISEIFLAMNIKPEDRAAAKLHNFSDQFPYVNGGLFSGSTDTPIFSKIARSYLISIGNLDWQKINPDIFGSMIQAVADDEERDSLGMHYTSVPNILKVLNPLFLDDLREKLEEAGDNARKLLNLRERIKKIRVFDPACGSGNFLVIAYKELRKIEFEINQRRGEEKRPTDISLKNFRGIEINDFPAEIARLALIIAEFQANVNYLGQQEAKAKFLPLDQMNWILCANALRVDWLSVCPPTGTGVKFRGDDLFSTPLDQAEIDFENEGGETYICGNPPYLGSTWQSKEQKEDLKSIFDGRSKLWKSLDYVAGWFMKAADYGLHTPTISAFVSTNSICQGQQVPILWPLVFETGHEIVFAHTSFKWANLAAHNAGVTTVIVGISKDASQARNLYSLGEDGETIVLLTSNINAFLVASKNIIIEKSSVPICGGNQMEFGNKATDGGNLLLNGRQLEKLDISKCQKERFIFPILGSEEFIQGKMEYCIWISDADFDDAQRIPEFVSRFNAVKSMRQKSSKLATIKKAGIPYQFDEVKQSGNERSIFVPSVSSENRPYLPVGLLNRGCIVKAPNFALYDAPLWNMALIASKLHLVWIATVCGKLETRIRYSNTLGWNTFPVPKLTQKNKDDMTRCAEDILLAREAHFPATIADLYDPEKMPENLRAAHDRNDEVLERIYIGRRFKNDTERLEKLFEMYTKMTTKVGGL